MTRWQLPESFFKRSEALLINLNGELLLYDQNRWQTMTVADLDASLRLWLENAQYIDNKGDVRYWMPSNRKIVEVISSLRVVATPSYVLGELCDLDVKSDAPEGGWFGKPKGELIPCRNGLLRRVDRKVLKYTPLFFNRYVLPYDYNPSAVSEPWDKRFMNGSFFEDSIQTVEMWGGYIISGRMEQKKALVVVGQTDSGKTMLAKVLEGFVPDYAHTGFSPDSLRDRFAIASLIGKVLVTISDGRVNLQDKRFVDFVLRTVGRDEQSIRPPHAKIYDVFKGVLPCRLTIMSNYPPIMPDDSRAIVERLVAVVTRQSFSKKKDDKLLPNLLVPESMSGILNRFLDGLDELDRLGKFVQPESGMHLINMMDQLGSPVKQFLRECCDFAPDHYEWKDDVLFRFESFCRANSFAVIDASNFAVAVYAASNNHVRPCKPGGKGKQRPAFKGLRLRPLGIQHGKSL